MTFEAAPSTVKNTARPVFSTMKTGRVAFVRRMIE